MAVPHGGGRLLPTFRPALAGGSGQLKKAVVQPQSEGGVGRLRCDGPQELVGILPTPLGQEPIGFRVGDQRWCWLLALALRFSRFWDRCRWVQLWWTQLLWADLWWARLVIVRHGERLWLSSWLVHHSRLSPEPFSSLDQGRDGLRQRCRVGHRRLPQPWTAQGQHGHQRYPHGQGPKHSRRPTRPKPWHRQAALSIAPPEFPRLQPKPGQGGHQILPQPLPGRRVGGGQGHGGQPSLRRSSWLRGLRGRAWGTLTRALAASG